MKIKNIKSPNFDKKKRLKSAIKFIVIHYTGMQSERESIIRLCNPKFKVSSHFLINRKGKVYQLVKENLVAWHAGVSRWSKYRNLNKNSIGIELVNKGHQFGYTAFSKKQLSSLVKICKNLIKKYKIKKKNIVGHSDIAPLRKKDPGEKFPWQNLSKYRIGIWHTLKPDFLKKFRRVKISKKEERKLVKNLNNIGYYFSLKKDSNKNSLFKAFQRHYRKELINGIPDKECSIIGENISKRSKKS